MSRQERDLPPERRRGLDPSFNRVVGRRLRSLMDRRTRDRDWVAGEVGVSQWAVRNWETGESAISQPNMMNLASTFAVPLEYLCCMEFAHLTSEQLALLPDHVVCRAPLSANTEMKRSIAAGASA